jgi:vacuolar-type H+-ATPase subunit E/Vma4
MTGPTLIDALRRKGTEEVEAVWQSARADADKRRAGAARAVEEQRARAAQEVAAQAADFERAAIAEAERTARKSRAAAKAALADRLHRLAVDLLPKFRDDHYPELFGALGAELPLRSWQRVTVNAADHGRAQECFPQAEVRDDPAISGGMDVEAEEGRVRIGNTLEARLETAWPEILPPLMKEVLDELSHS